MKLGIVGLPNVGKSSLFNALTQNKAQSENYPFCTIDPNVGVVNVPDERLVELTKIYTAKKTVPAVIEFIDIAGLVKGASKGEGLGNKFLGNIRETQAIIHVVRCFEDENVLHVDGSVNPIRDIETIKLELIFSDLESINKRIQKIGKGQRPENKEEYLFLQKLIECLENGDSINSLELSEEEKDYLKEYNLLSDKPVIYVANVSDNDLDEDNDLVCQVRELAEKENNTLIKLSVRLEEEISDLSEEEKYEFLEEMGLKESGLDRLIKASYDLLGLISYLTAGEQEVRAWTITKGTKAPQAAGKIHSDFERGFIKAEVISYDDLVRVRSLVKAKEEGLVRLEGKEYIVKDGDVIVFKFNV